MKSLLINFKICEIKNGWSGVCLDWLTSKIKKFPGLFISSFRKVECTYKVQDLNVVELGTLDLLQFFSN